MNMKKILAITVTLALMAGIFTACGKEQNGGDEQSEMTPVTVILDYIPNTNHTGLYAALSNGYYEAEGLKVEIIEPTEGATSALIATGKGDFGISFQEDVLYARAAADPLPIRAIATIIQHNTSGFASYKEKNINSPKDFEGKTYSGWGSPSEEAVIQAVMTKEGADFSKVNIVSAGDTGYEVLGEKVDFQWYFYAWDYMMAKAVGIELNYMELKDLDERLDYYTPVIITNEDTIQNSPELIEKFLHATKRGYEYAIEHPEAAATILYDNTSGHDLEMLKASQEYLAGKYIDDAPLWGVMKDEVWNRYAEFMQEYGLIEKTVPASECYTNEFLE